MATPTDALPRYEFHPGNPTESADKPATASEVTFAAEITDQSPAPAETLQPTRVEREHHEVYELADRRPLVVSAPPNSAFAEAYRPFVVSAVQTLQDYVKTALAVRDDPTLSDVGKEQKLAPQVTKAAQALHKIADTVLTKGAAAMSKRTSLLTVPPVEPGNAAQQLADRECREWFRGLSAEDRAEVMPKLMSGKLPAVAKALARSPIPLNIEEEKIELAWRESVMASDPGTFADLAQEEEAADWAYLLTKRAAGKLLGSHGVTPQAIAKALSEAGADDVGPFAGVTYTPNHAPKGK